MGESIDGLTPDEIIRLGMLWRIIHSGIEVVRCQGFTADLSVFQEDDGRYSKSVDLTIEGMTIRLTAVLPSETEAALLALRDELAP